MWTISGDNIGHVKPKSAFEHVQNAQIKTILLMHKVLSRPLLSSYTFCSLQWFCWQTVKARMCRLIPAFAVGIWPKTCFSKVWPLKQSIWQMGYSEDNFCYFCTQKYEWIFKWTLFTEYSLELPYRDNSTEYPQHMFWYKNNKNYSIHIYHKYSDTSTS